ncbi:MAG: tetratricopeptide repeat protein [Pirellulaceae bacterium]|nr:tetratricopeptide repeat protein [Pirellulaceae bacterium]
MSSDTSVPFSADAIAHLYRWDEIEGWRLLLDHLELIEGFSLVIVLAPDEWGVALARERLSQQWPGSAAVRRVRFDPVAGTDGLAESLLELASQPPHSAEWKAVWIDADPAPPERLEQREQDWRRALAKLNRYRNTLQAKLACTLVIALPARFQKAVAESAPDIWSIRSGVFRIEPPGGSRAAIELLPAEEREMLRRAADGDTGDPAETLAAAEKLRGKPGREALRARLLQRAGNQARHRLQWQVAETSLQHAYSLQATVGDPELHWEIALDWAGVFQDTAQYDRAEFYLRQALDIAERTFGPDDTKTAVTLNNLAWLLRNTNRLAEAEPLMRRALAIDEKAYGADDPDVAVDLNNLALLLKATNRLAEAEPLMRRALAIVHQSLGPEHPYVANCLNNLAQLFRGTNRLGEAEPLMRRALAINEKAYGGEHPSVARNLNNLAQLLQDKDRLAEAEPLMRRALAIDEKAYGVEHPDIAIDLNNLSVLLDDTNRLAEAESLMRRALDVLRASLGDGHPNTQTAADNYRRLLEKMKCGKPA